MTTLFPVRNLVPVQVGLTELSVARGNTIPGNDDYGLFIRMEVWSDGIALPCGSFSSCM